MGGISKDNAHAQNNKIIPPTLINVVNTFARSLVLWVGYAVVIQSSAVGFNRFIRPLQTAPSSHSVLYFARQLSQKFGSGTKIIASGARETKGKTHDLREVR